MNTCRLCNEQKGLINAHVIPKWAFMSLYPDDPEESNLPLNLIEKNTQTRRPIGPYDQNILCADCDGYLGKYDGYAKDVFLNSDLKQRGEEAYLIQNVDFEKIRIFLISIAWRASISGRDEFKKISIGPYEDRIKEILLNIKDGNQDTSLGHYSFLVTKFDEGELPNNVVNKHVQIPHTQRIEGVNVVVFYLPRGLKIFLKIDKKCFPDNCEKIAQYQKEGLIVARLGNYTDSDEFRAILPTIYSLLSK